MLECSCVLDNDKRVFKYLTEEVYVKHSRDFNVNRANLRIHEQSFIFIPFLRKKWSIVKDILALYNLWSMKQLEDLMLLGKQLKWSQGIELVLDSRSCQRLYMNLPHTAQNVFCSRLLRLPYEKIHSNDEDEETRDERAMEVFAGGRPLVVVDEPKGAARSP